jgi:hypothetical protein
MISSIDLFFSRDAGVGFGPPVDAPNPAPLDASSGLAFAGAWRDGCDAPELAVGCCPPKRDVAGAAVAVVPDVLWIFDGISADVVLACPPREPKRLLAGAADEEG